MSLHVHIYAPTRKRARDDASIPSYIQSRAARMEPKPTPEQTAHYAKHLRWQTSELTEAWKRAEPPTGRHGMESSRPFRAQPGRDDETLTQRINRLEKEKTRIEELARRERARGLKMSQQHPIALAYKQVQGELQRAILGMDKKQ